MTEEAVIPVEIPNTLLQKARILNKDTIGSKYDFVKHTGNQFIQVEPATAKFAGYEINKLNTIKISVLNKASVPQRIHVMPLESNTFTIKMNKKGLLPTGISEEISISFKPSEYRYYYDTIRINTETENILVPIHAFPVLDRQNLRNIFPRLIDFGTVIIGETSTIVSDLVCKIPINFEFEFTITEKNPDIRIFPTSGIVPASGAIAINLTYTPSSNTTLVIDAELKISQFEFQPLKIRLMGSGRYADPAANKAKTLKPPLSATGLGTGGQGSTMRRPQSGQKLLKLDPISLESQRATAAVVAALQGTNLQNQKSDVLQINASQNGSNLGGMVGNSQQDEKKRLRPSSEKSFKVRGMGSTLPPRNRSAIPKEQQDDQSVLDMQGTQAQEQFQMLQMTGISRQQNEREFIDKCNAVQLMDKNKEIKFFQCVGDEQITTLETSNILIERTNFHQATKDAIYQEGFHRYSQNINTDQVITDSRSSKLVTNCTWDSDKNDNLKLRKIVLHRFMKAGTKIIQKMRMENRLMSLKYLLEGCSTKQQVRELVNRDWQKAEYAGIGKKEFINFEFALDEDDIDQPLFPVQYEASNALLDINFPVDPRTNFTDLDLHEFSLLPRNEVEVMRYSNIDRPQYPNYLPLESHRKERSGAEWEYAYNGKPDLKNVKASAAESLKVPLLSERDMRQFLKPMEVAPFTFITSHETLRAYAAPEYDFVENDAQYFLHADKQLEIQDALDPKSSGEFFALKNEFFGKTPGLHSRFALYNIKPETIAYLPKRLNLPVDCANIKKHERECPASLKEIEYNDNLTDDDSDGEENPTLTIQNVDDFLKQLEDKDTVMSQVRDKNKERLPFDDYESTVSTISSNLRTLKFQQISSYPSLSANHNRFINSPADKLVVL